MIKGEFDLSDSSVVRGRDSFRRVIFSVGETLTERGRESSNNLTQRLMQGHVEVDADPAE